MRKLFLLLIAGSSLLVAGCHTPNDAARWEYRTTDNLQELNKLADQGWIVVNFAIPESGPYVYLLKRAKP